MKYFKCALLLLLCGCASHEVTVFDESAWRQKVEATDSALLYADHTDKDGRFFNPWLPREAQGFNVMKALSYLLSENDFKPDFPEDNYKHVENSYDYLNDPLNESISFAGHASFIIKMDGQTIFTDPFFSDKALTVNKKVKLPFDFNKVPDRPVVLISHNHYDHLDKYSVTQLIKRDAVFIVPLKLGKFLKNQVCPSENIYELDWWQSVELNGIKYTLLPAQHWSKRVTQGSNKTLWGGFMVEGSKTIYFSGDTGYFKGYKEFGRIYDIDYAILAAGAYIPRQMMHYAHQNVDEFFMAADDLKAKISIPMHFGIIGLGREPILYPLWEVEKYIEKNPEYKDKTTPLRVGEYIATGGNE